jgi:hypothetical protein
VPSAFEAAFATTADMGGASKLVRAHKPSARPDVVPLPPLADAPWTAEAPVSASARAAAPPTSRSHDTRKIRDGRHLQAPQAPPAPSDAGSIIAGGAAPSGGSSGTGMAAIAMCLLVLALVGVARRTRDADDRPRSTYRLLLAERPG